MMRMALAGASLLICTWASIAGAAEFKISMMNYTTDGGDMQFDPQLLKVSPGDTVHFVAVDKGHNAQSVDGMIPDGAKPFSGPIGGDFAVTLTVPGVYGYRCTPHGTLGMVGLIVVGNPANEDQAKAAAMPGMAGHVFAKLFQTLDTRRTAKN
jgi:pseudoazurin